MMKNNPKISEEIIKEWKERLEYSQESMYPPHQFKCKDLNVGNPREAERAECIWDLKNPLIINEYHFTEGERFIPFSTNIGPLQNVDFTCTPEKKCTLRYESPNDITVDEGSIVARYYDPDKNLKITFNRGENNRVFIYFRPEEK